VPDLAGRVAVAGTLYPAAQKVEELDAYRLGLPKREMELHLTAEGIWRGRRQAVAALDPNRGLDARAGFVRLIHLDLPTPKAVRPRFQASDGVAVRGGRRAVGETDSDLR
jgi:hypothetical protein